MVMKTISVLLLAMLVSGCGGYGNNSTASVPQPGAIPVISELVPNSAKAGSPAFTLTVNGSGFNSDAIVNWNGTKTTFVTGKQLTATVPASAVATPGTVKVTVTNPGHAGGGAYGSGGTMAETSGSMDFTVN